MKRHKTFKLGPHTIKIKYAKDLKGDDGRSLYGVAIFHLNTIYVCTQFGADKVDEEVIEHTLAHEAVHFFLNYLNLHDMNGNDPLVDTLSAVMLQYFKTLK